MREHAGVDGHQEYGGHDDARSPPRPGPRRTSAAVPGEPETAAP